jgi:hypothetical protein
MKKKMLIYQVWIILVFNVLKFWFWRKYGVHGEHVVTRSKGELSLRTKIDARQDHINWDERKSYIYTNTNKQYLSTHI